MVAVGDVGDVGDGGCEDGEEEEAGGSGAVGMGRVVLVLERGVSYPLPFPFPISGAPVSPGGCVALGGGVGVWPCPATATPTPFGRGNVNAPIVGLGIPLRRPGADEDARGLCGGDAAGACIDALNPFGAPTPPPSGGGGRAKRAASLEESVDADVGGEVEGGGRRGWRSTRAGRRRDLHLWRLTRSGWEARLAGSVTWDDIDTEGQGAGKGTQGISMQKGT